MPISDASVGRKTIQVREPQVAKQPCLNVGQHNADVFKMSIRPWRQSASSAVLFDAEPQPVTLASRSNKRDFIHRRHSNPIVVNGTEGES